MDGAQALEEIVKFPGKRDRTVAECADFAKCGEAEAGIITSKYEKLYGDIPRFASELHALYDSTRVSPIGRASRFINKTRGTLNGFDRAYFQHIHHFVEDKNNEPHFPILAGIPERKRLPWGWIAQGAAQAAVGIHHSLTSDEAQQAIDLYFAAMSGAPVTGGLEPDYVINSRLLLHALAAVGTGIVTVGVKKAHQFATNTVSNLEGQLRHEIGEAFMADLLGVEPSLRPSGVPGFAAFYHDVSARSPIEFGARVARHYDSYASPEIVMTDFTAQARPAFYRDATTIAKVGIAAAVGLAAGAVVQPVQEIWGGIDHWTPVQALKLYCCMPEDDKRQIFGNLPGYLASTHALISAGACAGTYLTWRTLSEGVKKLINRKHEK